MVVTSTLEQTKMEYFVGKNRNFKFLKWEFQSNQHLIKVGINLFQ